MKELIQEHGWIGATILILIQFLYGIWKDRSKEDRKILLKILKDVNMSFAFLRIMAGDKYHDIIKRVNEEKVMRE